MLMRFDPLRDFDNLTQMINRTTSRLNSMMAMDAWREGDSFIIKFDVPGVDPDSVNLTVERNVLSVRAERSWQPPEGAEVLVAERPQGQFSRQLFLGENLDTDRIEARLEGGVLTIAIPVAEQAKPRKVAVASEGREGSKVEAQPADSGADSSAGEKAKPAERQPEPASSR